MSHNYAIDEKDNMVTCSKGSEKTVQPIQNYVVFFITKKYLKNS